MAKRSDKTTKKKSAVRARPKAAAKSQLAAKSQAPKPRRSTRRKAIVPRTEGQRLLLDVEGTQAQIAEQGGWSKQLVSYWQRGEKKPSAKNRMLLEDLFGIDATSWAFEPKAAKKKRQPASAIAARKKAPEKLMTLDHTRELAHESRRLRMQEGMLPSQQARIIETELKSIALVARLERDRELIETRIVTEHPMWRRIRECIVAALEEHPDAARDVARALEGLGV